MDWSFIVFWKSRALKEKEKNLRGIFFVRQISVLMHESSWEEREGKMKTGGWKKSQPQFLACAVRNVMCLSLRK